MIKKFIQLIGGKDCDLQERVLRSIILLGGLATLIGITEIFFVMEITNVLLPMLFVLLVVMGIIMFITFKYRKYDMASIMLGLIIIVIVFPVMFILSAATDSGADIWLALGILYIFLMFSGKRLAVFMTLSLISYGFTYLLAYYHPSIIVPMPSRAHAYIDSVFSIFAVGIMAGLILKAQMHVYNEEHQLNIEQKEELEKNSKSKDVFFANMSHEIRTPINAVLGLNEMILRESESEQVREYARDIQIASNMLLNQVNDILDISRMEVNRMQIVPVEYRTADVLSDLIELVKVQANKKGLELEVDIDKNLPSVLRGDEKRIRQVLLNILDNAVKYTEEGSVTFGVEAETCTDDSIIIKFKIADTGIGIRKENLADIYDAFSRFDEEHHKRILGTGLGLAITKRLVDLMDGEITVDSIYRKGTIFSVAIPQRVVNAGAMGEVIYHGKNVEEREEYKPLFVASKARILIVDDSNMNRMVASRLLSSTKVQIDTASGGAECLEMTRKKYYHVILLDYLMPDMDGLETLRAIREQENGLCRETPVISLTGSVASGISQEYLEQGFDGYVAKPIQSKLLEHEILSFLPEDVVEYREEAVTETEGSSQLPRYFQRKRKKIYITADCTCDIPPELLDKYDIKLMYLYVKTPNGRFADTREIDSDSIAQYVTPESITAHGDRVSVGEFEEFFAEALTQAEEVIHISLSSKLGKSHGVAVEAAKGFDHVHVIDSGQISCGQGLVTLYAAKLAAEGKTVIEICNLVEKMKPRVHTNFVMPGADIFHHSGRMKTIFVKLCRAMQLHPYGGMRQKKTRMYALLGGTLEQAWKQAIFLSFLNKRKVNTDIVFITHVCCSVKKQDRIKRELLKQVPFKQVISNKTSFTTACSVGMHTIGYAYYTDR